MWSRGHAGVIWIVRPSSSAVGVAAGCGILAGISAAGCGVSRGSSRCRGRGSGIAVLIVRLLALRLALQDLLVTVLERGGGGGSGRGGGSAGVDACYGMVDDTDMLLVRTDAVCRMRVSRGMAMAAVHLMAILVDVDVDAADGPDAEEPRGAGHGDDAAAGGLLDLALLELLLEHGLPDPSARVGEPVLELLLVDAGLVHEHDLVLRRGVGVREVLRGEQPGLEGGHGSGRQFSAGLAGLLGRGGGVVSVVGLRRLDVCHVETLAVGAVVGEAVGRLGDGPLLAGLGLAAAATGRGLRLIRLRTRLTRGLALAWTLVLIQGDAVDVDVDLPR